MLYAGGNGWSTSIGTRVFSRGVWTTKSRKERELSGENAFFHRCDGCTIVNVRFIWTLLELAFEFMMAVRRSDFRLIDDLHKFRCLGL